MEIDFIFRVAGVGLIVAVLHILVSKSGREEQALFVTLSGLIVVLLMIIPKIGTLFDTIKAVFGL